MTKQQEFIINELKKEHSRELHEYQYNAWDVYWELEDDGSLFHHFREAQMLDYSFDTYCINSLNWKWNFTDEEIKNELAKFNKKCGSNIDFTNGEDLLKMIEGDIHAINDYYTSDEFLAEEINQLGAEEFIDRVLHIPSERQKIDCLEILKEHTLKEAKLYE